MKPIARKPTPRRFHQARWDEPIIFELSQPGERGVLMPTADPLIEEEVGDGLSALPPDILRQEPPALPELGQMQVLKHFLRLSQENLGADMNVDVGQGTCTMKYSPKINDQLAASPKVAALHPLQPLSCGSEGHQEADREARWRLSVHPGPVLLQNAGPPACSLHHPCAPHSRRWFG